MIKMLASAALALTTGLQAQTTYRANATTGLPGTPARVLVQKTGNFIKFNFTIPQGTQGFSGPQGPAGASPFTLSGSNAIFSSGNVGIGNDTPGARLTIGGSASVGSSNGVGLISVGPTGAYHLALDVDDIMAYNGNIPTQIDLAYYGGGVSLAGNGNGNVGIGAPPDLNARLSVKGDIMQGDSGEFYATADQEKLAIVRGGVNGFSGTATAGAGFTVTRISTGFYTVFFDTSFAGAPTITGTIKDTNSNYVFTTGSVTASSFNVFTNDNTNSNTDLNFDFIAIGPR